MHQEHNWLWQAQLGFQLLAPSSKLIKAQVAVAGQSLIQNLNYNLQLNLLTIFSGNSLGKKNMFTSLNT